MMCATGAGSVGMWKTAMRFLHIPTASTMPAALFRIKRKNVANRDDLC